LEFITAVILGVVEGFTEFLPVSSTGHLLIAEHLLGVQKSDAFNVLIQVGPIVAAVLVFWKDILRLFTGMKNPVVRDELIKLVACFGLTGAAGLVIKKLGFELPESVIPIIAATVIGGLIIFIAERLVKGRILADKLTWAMVVAVAAGQMLAGVFPGTSRSGAAVIAAMLIGLSRPAAVRFAFLVGIPTMFAAGALQIKEAVGLGQTGELLAPDAITAFVVAIIAAWVSVVWLLRFVQKNTFIPFAWYRLALGGAMIALLAAGML
jgi:undecaprenyl-diphosphatase